MPRPEAALRRPGPALVRALQDWRLGLALLAAVAAVAYGPALNRVFAADQLSYFAEVRGEPSLAAGLRHIDYALSRTYWRGDDLLFRPLLFVWLAIANALFGYHHTWWNAANLAIHVGVAAALLRLLLEIRVSAIALPAAVLFLVLEPPMELVLWNHLGGYMLACLFLTLGLRSFVRLLRGATGWQAAAFAVPLTLASLSYEAMVPIAAAAAAIVVIARWRQRRLSAGDTTILFSPVLVFSAIYGVHALNAPRLGYVDRADGRTLLEAARAGNVVDGMARMVVTWTSELALPTALQLSSAPFERFAKAFTIDPSRTITLVNIIVLVLGGGLLAFSISRVRLGQSWPLLTLLAVAIGAYTFLIAFGRSADEVAAITYYAYVFCLLMMLLAYAAVDFERLAGWRVGAAAILVVVFAGLHARETAATVREVERVNHYPALYLTRVIRFVEAHRSEPDFTFRIEAHPESLDPTVTLVAGYPNDPAAPREERRVTEILFAPYYRAVDPKYVLSASAERIVQPGVR